MGEFPNSLKIARIVPIYKDGNPQDTANYRPINILSPISKIFEMVLYDRINGFINKFQIINKNQYGFQKMSGTLSATANVLNHIQSECDSRRRKLIGCVFIDLRKAFDTVPHKLLLQKLKKYGIRGKTHSIIKSYFMNRRHYTDINNTHSEMFTNRNPFSVQQGSNLGPMLFLLYIYDIFNLKLNGKLIMFADDAILIVSDSDHCKLQQLIQEDIDCIYEWLINNKLSMNIKKTKLMIIKQSPKGPMANYELKIKNQKIEEVDHLGLIIQNNLKWDKHINRIKRKIIAISGIIARLGNRINNTTLLSIYYSYIHSQIAYLSPKIFYKNYYIENISTETIYKRNKILKIDQIIESNSAILNV